MLPPGSRKDETKPERTISSARTTMGIVPVASCAARPATWPPHKRTSTWSS